MQVAHALGRPGLAEPGPVDPGPLSHPAPAWQHRRVADRAYEDPRLAAVYDALNADRSDLDAYALLAAELGARSVLDLGCGTGTLALALAARGLEVTAVDPAAGMLQAAQEKPGAERVRWLLGTATSLPALQVDLAVMTGNVAQAVVDPVEWAGTLSAARGALRPGGHLVLESRDPALRAWERWTPADSRRTTDLPGSGQVETWLELLEVRLPLVVLRETYAFAADGAVVTSESTLRFRERDELRAALDEQGFEVADVRDSPGGELVLVARRP